MEIKKLDINDLIEDEELYEKQQMQRTSSVNFIDNDEDKDDITTPLEANIRSQIDSSSSKFSIIADELSFQHSSQISKYSQISNATIIKDLFKDS